jgi:pimeloyl-ACP methyl ester carboxylesterase
MVPLPTTLYLHGFASSPASRKAVFFAERLAEHGIPLVAPDLNEGDFFHLTTTRAIRSALALVDASTGPVLLLGSSFGGRVAVHVACARPDRVRGIVLMAPAFHFERLWYTRLGPLGIERWQREGELRFDHLALGVEMPLGYGSFQDARLTDGLPRLRPDLPGLLFHGVRDEAVPLEDSHRFAELHPAVTLHALDSDHRLHDQCDHMWSVIRPALTSWRLLP